MRIRDSNLSQDCAALTVEIFIKKKKILLQDLPMGVLERGGEGRVTCLRLFLGLSTLIRACLQAKLTEVS